VAENREILREFLISLGFQIDETGIKKFFVALTGINKLLGTTGTVLASVVVASESMVNRFARHMEGLYYASRRTRASVSNLQALEFGAEQIGVSADTAR
jgi:hypothetical protein